MCFVDAEATSRRPCDSALKPTVHAYVVLAVGVFSVSTGAILVRFAQHEAGSLAIAAYRMGFASVVVLIPTLIYQRRELLSLSYRDLALAATSGLFLAVHFAAWMVSLEMTSVAISVTMVNTSPLWVGLLTPLITREPFSKGTILGIALSVVGAMWINWGQPGEADSSNDLLGAMWATVGALGLAIYLLIGRNMRRRHSLGVYVTVCYCTATGYLFLSALGAGQQVTGFSSATWWCLIGLALVSQILGHTANNWALRYLSASMVAVALLGEPILSSMMAYLFFDEFLTAKQVGGATLILVGIYCAARAEQH